MPARIVICTVIGLILACLGLLVLGQRIRRGHWSVSLAAIATVAAGAWALQRQLTGQAPPLYGVLMVALSAGAAVTAAFRHWNLAGHACFTAAGLAAGVYIAYTGFVLTAAHLGPWSIAFGLLLLVLQLAAMGLLIVHTFEIIDVICRTHWQRVPRPLHLPSFDPLVSIHVPTHREPPEMVIETLNAIARLDYANYEVLVIDNNTEDEKLWRPVKEHCARLGPKFRFFHVLPWPGYKAGALNFALDQTDPEAEIIAIVDADYLVEPNWLADLVSHFIDPQLAFVQTPQDYRDADARGPFGRAMALAYDYFFRISMPSRNESNAIIFAGTMGLIRKSALQEVGSWDEWCITEDAEVSLRLLNAGYRSLYVDQTYGRGIMPLDYTGLKKQRFRWAFGGMQLLRMHAAKLFNPWEKTGLTGAQRWAYVSAGLQWLNDPITLAFTALLLIGATALLAGGTIAVQPLVGAVVFVPFVFIFFAIARFLWALRIRARCSAADAIRALMVLLGLTWVVTLACVRGLVSRQGEFLRTPKQGGTASIRDSFGIVRWELLLGVICLAAGAALVVAGPDNLLSARGAIIVLLGWQAAIYLSAVATSLWDYRQRRDHAVQGHLGFRTLGPTVGRVLSERQMALWVVLGVLIAGALLYYADRRAPVLERVYRADPLQQFVPAPSVLQPNREDLAGAVLVLESDAAQRGDVAAALALWSPDGVIIDHNFTSADPGDDRIWRGLAQLHARYRREFRQRQYVELAHLNLRIKIEGDLATITNDLDAVITDARTGKTERVQLPQSDRWVLRQVDGRWQVQRLEINRAERAASGNRQDAKG